MALDGKELAVEELLASVRSGAPTFPHPMKIDEEASWCPAPYLLPDIPLKEGDDPEFYGLLMRFLRNKPR